MKRKLLEMEIERLENEVAELSESSFYLKQEKEENGKVISQLVKRIEEGVEKERSAADESWVKNRRCALGSEILYIEAWHHADRVEHPSSQTGLDVGVGRKSYHGSHINCRRVTLQHA